MDVGTAIKPELIKDFPNAPRIWKCPKTGLKVPKNPEANLAWRAELLGKADHDEGLQRDLYFACKESTLFYLNTFGMTFRQKMVNIKTGKEIPCLDPHVPFITWAIQDVAVDALEYAIEHGEDIAIDKSRDMGASWLCLGVLDKHWLFDDDFHTLMLSRTEAYVDQAGNAKSLFWKIDYLNEWLPEWLRPPACLPGQKNRTKMHIVNEWTGSVIDGESTTDNAARGDRRKVVFMDEFGAVTNGRAMRAASADVTPCRIINSTPRAGSEYSSWILSGKIKTIRLPWYEHPEKGAGRYAVQDDITQKWTIHSPWLKNEEARRSPAEMAEEIHMNHMGAGSMFFESTVLEQHKALFGTPPKHTRKIRFHDDVSNKQIAKVIKQRSVEWVKVTKSSSKTELNIWAELIDGRLDQSKTYSFGVDISKGQGASNSTISILCDQTNEKVAEFANANIPPYELAPIVAAISIWIGGANPRRLPRIAWEANGPGWDFGKIFVTQYLYPFCYYHEAVGTKKKTKPDKYGWHNSRQSNEELLSVYRRHLAHNEYINHSIPALEEASMYLYYENGAIGPAFLVEESAGAKATHGDRVRADAISCLFKSKNVAVKHESAKAPAKSAGARREKLLHQRANERKLQGRTFDFRNSNKIGV